MRQDARLGMTLLIISESIFFFMLVVAFVAFRSQSAKLAVETLSLPVASMCTFCLLASSFTVWRAARIAGSEDSASPRIWLAATIVLGLAFLLGQVSEYLRLVHHGVTIGGNLFGTTFFTLTGMQALHVVVGLLLLLGLLRIAGPGGSLTSQWTERVHAVAAFWHFIDGVWVVIFLVVYLWTFL
jgi:cytochrome c oxidase subunit III